MNIRYAALLLLLIGVACPHVGARAEVTRIEIASRTDVLAGKPFGDAGPYEKVIGKVYFATGRSSISTRRRAAPTGAWFFRPTFTP
jgi:hypothetical protein